MSPPQPSLLEAEEAPLGWEGARFPLSKPLLSKLAGDSMRRSTLSKRSRESHLPNLSPRSYGRNVANMRILSKTRKGWSYLSFKFKEGKPRKGELAPELVDAIWGTQIPLMTFRSFDCKASFLDPESEIRKIRAKKHQGPKVKTAESLMDILLQNWTYFEHAHGQDDVIEKHVHAKYCENEFGHFLLSGNQHIHGQFYVHLHLLVSELRQLLSKLRDQILPTHYQTLPVWSSPQLEEAPELEIPPLPAMPKLYPIEGLLPVPSEEDECIPCDLEAPVFKPSISKELPPLILPEPLKVPRLKLPIMAALLEDESSIDYGSYEEAALPVFVLPCQDPLPVWVEPSLAELPQAPEYVVPEVIPPPVQEPIPSFRVPLMDPRPCEKAYYDLDSNQRGICDGLCSKHGHKHHFVPGQQRREPCFAKPPPLLPLPVPPFPGADTILLDSKDGECLASTGFLTEDCNNIVSEMISKSWVSALPIVHEPSFEPPLIESVPDFQPPTVIEEPVFVPLSSPKLPPWREPNPPAPLGWLVGQRPIFLIDCGSAMAGERMEAVQRCLRELFCPGGQVEVAATHFDIIMYSFDAWSYGEIENSYIYKQASGTRYLRPLEPMRVKASETLESALNWVTRWHPAGTSNLWKALTIATSRTFADCIYLFSEGKADKPVLIVEFLKQQAQMQGGQLTPIYTVGLRTSKPKARFLKRLSAVTGGQFLDYDYKQMKKPEEQTDEMQDMLWAQAMVEAEQRKNAETGRVEDLRDILKRVEIQYEPTRLVPRLEAHQRKCIELKELYHSQVEAIRNENARNALHAREQYEQLIADIGERNRLNYEVARIAWEFEVEEIRTKNRLLIGSFLKWRQEMDETRRYNEDLVSKFRKQFLIDLKEVEMRDASIMEKAEQKYRLEVERINKKNQDAVDDVARRQKELAEKIASINQAWRQEYERALSAVQASNAALLKQTQELYEEQLTWVKARNAKAIEDAQAQFTKHCGDVRAENARKKVALAQRLEDIKRRREEAIAAHQVDVAEAIAEHGGTVKAYNALNAENERRARVAWKRACDEIVWQNKAAEKKAKEDFELEQIFVQEENIKLAERRLALKRHISDVVMANAELEKRKKLEWKAACAEVEREYEKEVAKSKEMHKRMVEEVKLRNAEKLQSSLVEHKAKVAAVESYNETVHPYVEASNAVRVEVRRIEAFLQCIADTILPRDRHILEKSLSKSPFESDLDLLQVSEVTLDTEMLIAALRSAYGKSLKTHKGNKSLGQQKPSSPHAEQDPIEGLSALIPVSPARAPSHYCLGRQNECANKGKVISLQVHGHSHRVAIRA
ncbi:hypothetical protein GOP47_0002041 [Adiantum capillus-veneris]|uniref:VWFA domain-containing protein n=1 Tax=Adiantum capillus-veneris TaxID=13818 RepID=A0A9D4ZNP1_ADICA|nr:hypothetical protein GOP47_0002041 [Adiantum capillus-veneris]